MWPCDWVLVALWVGVALFVLLGVPIIDRLSGWK